MPGLFNKEPVVGQCYEVSYRRGVGTVKGEISQAESAKLESRRAHSMRYKMFEHLLCVALTGIVQA